MLCLLLIFMKQFQLPVIVNGEKHMVIFAVGNPDPTHHPLHFQMDLLQKSGGEVLPEFSQAIEKLHKIAMENIIPLDMLCYYTARISGGINDKIMPISESEINYPILPEIDPVGN